MARRRWPSARLAAAALLVALAACAPEPLPPDELATVPRPDLGAAEPLVREQLEAERQALDALLARVDVAAEELAGAFGRVGQHYHAYDLLEPAEVCYRNARRLAPGAVRWIYLHGLVLARRGAGDSARSAFERTLELAPGNGPALLQLGNLALAENRLADARRRFEAALESEPTCQAARFGLGEVAWRGDDLETAARHFGRILEDQPEAQQVHYPLSQVLMRLGRREEAALHLDASRRREIAVGGRPHCPDPLDYELAEIRTGAAAAVRRGLLVGLAGDAEEELDLLRAAVAESPADVVARQRLGTLLLKRGEPEAAREQLVAAHELAPANPEILVALGVAAARLEQFDEAASRFRAALDLNPGSIHYRVQLALAVKQLGRCDEALALFAEVLDVEPAHPQALLQSSVCLATLGRTAEAGRSMARLLDVHPPGDPGERLRMASMLLSFGEHDVARRHFEIVAASDAPAAIRAQAHFLIGRVHLDRGDRAAAEASLRRAIELDPSLATPDEPPRSR